MLWRCLPGAKSPLESLPKLPLAACPPPPLYAERSADSIEMRFWQKLFSQLHEYLGKEALDVTACLSAHAEVVVRKPPSRGAVSGQPRGGAAGASAAMAAASAAAATEQKLRIVLSGGSAQEGLSHVRPFALVNDISLLTVLESYRLFGEGGSSGGSGEGGAS